MKHLSKIILSALLGTWALAATSLRATPVTVTDNGLDSYDGASIDSSTLGSHVNTEAGSVNLAVTEGAQTTNVLGFCVDPWNYSASGPQSYNLLPVTSAPETEGPMSAAAAKQIEQLWAQYMTATYALSSNSTTADVWSAALQLEIWQTVANSITNPAYTYSLNSVANGYPGEAAAIASDQEAMATFLADNPNAVTADLVALDSGSYQDFVIGAVPDAGSTAILTILGLFALLTLGRRKPAISI